MQQLFWKKIEIDNKKHGRPPKLEENVNLVYLIDQNRYLYFGGKNAFNIKDLHTEDKQPSPPKTDGISFKIGGTAKPARVSSPFGGNQECQEYVYLLDPSNYEWTIKKCTGKPPSRRTSAHVWYEAPLLFVYGGITYENKTASDLYYLNTEKFIWKRFFFLEGPPGRLHFGFSSQGPQKYLMGGASMPENLLMDDVWQLSFDNVAWNTQSLELPGITWEKLPFEDMPAIKAHSMIQVSDKELLIYGGFNKQKQCQDTCLLLDLEQYEISQLELKGISPGPRAFHDLIIVKESLLCLYGGYNVNENQLKNTEPLNDFYLLNLNEGYWSKPITGGYQPSPRFGYVIACNQNELHGEILILGGKLNDGTIDQCLYVLHELDMDAREAWDEKDENEKMKYDSYRDLKKENKTANVPTMTLVFDEAEKIILEQKRQIGDKERDLKALQQTSGSFESKAEQLQEQIDQKKLQKDKDLEDMRIEISEFNQKADQSQNTIDHIIELLALERKKRKLCYRKTIALEDLYRKTSLYIFEMDKVYMKGQSENLLETSINEDVLNNIDQRKQEYRNTLSQFHKSFEERHKQEIQIRQQIKSNKDILKQFYNIHTIYKQTLTKEDREFLEKQI